MAALYDPRPRQLTGEPFVAGPRGAAFELSPDGTLRIAEGIPCATRARGLGLARADEAGG